MNLHLDWCSYEAAKYAVEHWHYSGTLPVSKMNSIGVWEDKKYIGAVLFALGATPTLGKRYGLGIFECCELVRVALTNHASPVSRIVSIAIKMMKKKNSGVRLIVSFADPYHGHVGGIYQAMNWIYTGETSEVSTWEVGGRIIHRRAYTGVNYGAPKMQLPVHAEKIILPPKHRYLYPLDDAMRRQIEPLRKPYPKRGLGETDSARETNPETGGASPTSPLLEKIEVQ